MAMGLLAAAATAAGLYGTWMKGYSGNPLNGEVITPPWYITVDGENVALVESQEAAQDVLENIHLKNTEAETAAYWILR